MWHAHARTRRRAQALVRLAQSIAKAQVAREFSVHLNSIKAWIGRTVRSPSCGAAQEIIPGGSGTATASGAGRRRHGETPHAMHARAADAVAGVARHGGALVESNGVQLQALSHQCKKKRDAQAVARFRQQLEALTRQAGELALCFFGESGFSPNPPLQSGGSLRGQTRACCPESHRQRVNVLGGLQKGAHLVAIEIL
jgi:hypothetical protein